MVVCHDIERIATEVIIKLDVDLGNGAGRVIAHHFGVRACKLTVGQTAEVKLVDHIVRSRQGRIDRLVILVADAIRGIVIGHKGRGDAAAPLATGRKVVAGGYAVRVIHAQGDVPHIQRRGAVRLNADRQLLLRLRCRTGEGGSGKGRLLAHLQHVGAGGVVDQRARGDERIAAAPIEHVSVHVVRQIVVEGQGVASRQSRGDVHIVAAQLSGLVRLGVHELVHTAVVVFGGNIGMRNLGHIISVPRNVGGIHNLIAGVIRTADLQIPNVQRRGMITRKSQSLRVA